MAYSNRPSRRPIPGICPCHGAAPHVLTKKSPNATAPAKKSGKPRKFGKGSSGHARPQGAAGRPSYPARGGRSGQGNRR